MTSISYYSTACVLLVPQGSSQNVELHLIEHHPHAVKKIYINYNDYLWEKKQSSILGK